MTKSQLYSKDTDKPIGSTEDDDGSTWLNVNLMTASAAPVNVDADSIQIVELAPRSYTLIEEIRSDIKEILMFIKEWSGEN